VSRTIRIETMPSQKEGVASPAIEKVRTTRSIQLFCFNAEIVPSGIAIATAITVAISATSSEIGKRVAISITTGFPDHIDLPKSSRAKPHRKSRNCTIQGRSIPISAWQVASAAWVKLVPPEPRRTRQISPGTRRISRNTRAAAPIRVGKTRRMRLMM
jgi:hypothetical protein